MSFIEQKITKIEYSAAYICKRIEYWDLKIEEHCPIGKTIHVSRGGKKTFTTSIPNRFQIISKEDKELFELLLKSDIYRELFYSETLKDFKEKGISSKFDSFKNPSDSDIVFKGLTEFGYAFIQSHKQKRTERHLWWITVVSLIASLVTIYNIIR
tara:strand:- start:3194 stop:3658 length:465 start_codon:yes stop_codon:yes gene_type:complete